MSDEACANANALVHYLNHHGAEWLHRHTLLWHLQTLFVQSYCRRGTSTFSLDNRLPYNQASELTYVIVMHGATSGKPARNHICNVFWGSLIILLILCETIRSPLFVPSFVFSPDERLWRMWFRLIFCKLKAVIIVTARYRIYCSRSVAHGPGYPNSQSASQLGYPRNVVSVMPGVLIFNLSHYYRSTITGKIWAHQIHHDRKNPIHFLFPKFVVRANFHPRNTIQP